MQTNELPAGETIKVGRWPAFDGLRAVAVVAVIVYHLNYRPWTGGGYLGVDVFFVLSGFLITWLLVTEWDRLGGVSFRRFYARRGLRLLPALAAVIVFVVVVVEAVPAMRTYRHLTLVGLPFVILYSGNWAVTFGGAGTLSLGLLGSTWSLAVEEQFYLLWPAILVRLLRRFSRQRIVVLLTFAAFSDMAARQVINLAHVSWWPWWRSYYASVTHFDGLLLGCALAVAWGQRSSWPWLDRIGRKSGVAGAVAAAGLVAILIRANLDPDLMPLWMSAAALSTIVIMLDLLFRPGSRVNAVLEWRPLQWIGKRSYGLYLWHVPIFYLVDSMHLPGGHLRFERNVLAVAATFVVSAASYRIVEYPILQRKRRFARVDTGLATL